MSAIRKKFPVTLSTLGLRATRKECFLRICPPVHVSASGRVKRWGADARERAAISMFGITGNSAARLKVVSVGARTDISRLQAWGTHDGMRQLLATAVRTWGDLPGGREIETLFERMFPAKLELEVTPLVVKQRNRKKKAEVVS